MLSLGEHSYVSGCLSLPESLRIVSVGALEVSPEQLLAEPVSRDPCVIMTYLTDFVVENPAEKWPGVFAQIPFFVQYPYLLPCAVAASVTFLGKL